METMNFELGRCELCEKQKRLREDSICYDCARRLKAEVTLIDRLYAAGHSPECAANQIWGDVTCICSKNR